MLQLRHITVDQLNLEWGNFEGKLDTLSPQIEEAQVLSDAAQPPVLVRVVHATALEHSHGCELCSGEINLTGVLL